jgi:type VI secretion system protein ImpK
MNDDDDLSKTMVIPNPGGRRKTAGPIGDFMSPPSAPPAAVNYADQNASSAEVLGENKLLSYASDILILAGNVRTLEPNNTIEQLRRDIESLIDKFDRQLAHDNTQDEVALTARYLLCCLIDELVLTTPWGLDSAWSHQTLLAKYHNETSGGQKFFLIANKLMEQPQRNIDLIELCYVSLSLGFRGKYRLNTTGENDIVQISQMLYQPISLYRPVPNDLSPAWQAADEPKKGFEKRFPPMLFFLALAFICIAVYIALLSNLHAKASPLYEKIESIGWNDFVVQMSENQPVGVELTDVAAAIRGSLSQSIANGQVVVDIKDSILVIRLVSTLLFPPGSTTVNPQELPDVNTLVNAIVPYADAVIVVGHTDSTGRADSNWVISRKRAEAVEAWMKTAQNQVGQTITRGVADTQPLVNEAGSDFNQSLNRRVELMLVLRDDLVL